MKTNLRRMVLVALVTLASNASVVPAQAADGQASSLEELKRAMTEPSDSMKKQRTRAIVLDSDASKAPASTPVASAAPVDCAALPVDTHATAVQFLIQFKPGSAVISPTSAAILAEIAKILALAPDRCVIVEGHTDAQGNPERNLSLSRERASAVVKFIAEKGSVERSRLVPVGKGSNDPLRDLDPRDAKNRRVVFKVVAG